MKLTLRLTVFDHLLRRYRRAAVCCGKIIDARLGDIVTIKLAENPTTGYGWQFEIMPEEQNVIDVISSKYIAPRTTLIGTGGTKEYKFEIKNTGQITINGYYVRPWEETEKIKQSKCIILLMSLNLSRILNFYKPHKIAIPQAITVAPASSCAYASNFLNRNASKP